MKQRKQAKHLPDDQQVEGKLPWHKVRHVDEPADGQTKAAGKALAAAAPSLRRERNYGIDSMRILSMFYVLILHTLGAGGVLDNAATGSFQYAVSWLMEIGAYGALNVFGLISGYVGYRPTPKEPGQPRRVLKISSYLSLWLEVVFYGVGCCLVYMVIAPGKVTGADVLRWVFPVSNGVYWFFTAYTGVFFVMPLLNLAVEHCDRRTTAVFLIVVFFVFSLFDTFFTRFDLEGGYSFTWLAMLYLIGAIVKKYRFSDYVKPPLALLGIVLMTLVSWGWLMSGFSFSVYDTDVAKDVLVSYTSPTILVMSVLYLIIGAQFKPGKTLTKIVKFLAPGAFAVYLINTQDYMWNVGMSDRFVWLASRPTILIILVTLGFSLVYVAACLLIDKARAWLSRLLRVPQATAALERGCRKLLGRGL